jgi:D-tyrosyl-tRNA(Tyr) deacylase
VTVDDQTIGRIDRGLLVYVGLADSDSQADAEKLAGKVASIRIFDDGTGKLNRSVADVGGAILVIPNFTLQAEASKGRRPSFDAVMPADKARPLHEQFCRALAISSVPVEGGRFGADMQIHAVADGPVNLVLDIPG